MACCSCDATPVLSSWARPMLCSNDGSIAEFQPHRRRFCRQYAVLRFIGGGLGPSGLGCVSLLGLGLLGPRLCYFALLLVLFNNALL